MTEPVQLRHEKSITTKPYGIRSPRDTMLRARRPDNGGVHVQRGDRLIVLLVGGDKSTQSQDIKLALALARDL